MPSEGSSYASLLEFRFYALNLKSKGIVAEQAPCFRWEAETQPTGCCLGEAFCSDSVPKTGQCTPYPPARWAGPLTPLALPTTASVKYCACPGCVFLCHHYKCSQCADIIALIPIPCACMEFASGVVERARRADHCCAPTCRSTRALSQLCANRRPSRQNLAGCCGIRMRVHSRVSGSYPWHDHCRPLQPWLELENPRQCV